MKVIKWIDYESAEKLPENFLSCIRMPFTKDDYPTMKDYHDACETIEKPYFEAFRQSIIKNNIKEGGDWHQNNKNGVPLFDDNTVALFTYRSWSAYLSKIWSEEENKEYDTLYFYMSC